MPEPLLGEPDIHGADCVACGRCCHHGPHTVALSEADEELLGEDIVRRLVVVYDKPPYFHFLENHAGLCAALDTTVSNRFVCSIYERRPQGCRVVEPGSPCCLEARQLGHLGKSVEFTRSAKLTGS